ncbi:hypothetical protein DMP23_20790 [Amycolatopsis sp. A1MSW2902]|uniref:GAF domain-containing sensor histidine kinase n=1 Tax=Amycolatopsis sp. A1MSW2902 TaxID=687413 RepID=UPI00307F446C
MLRSALVVPWADPHGDGFVIAGRAGRTPVLPEAASGAVPQLGRNVRRRVSEGRRRGAVEINRDLQFAMKNVASAAVGCADVAETLTTLLVSAQRLFDTDVDYLSLPEFDIETFTFDQTLGIHTPEFRHLRIRDGQGLGGLARSLRRPVRSLNYAIDSRLHAAPVAETVREGIVSAMATPIIVDDQVEAVLYVGDRTLHPFNETDEEILNEFAAYATLGLKRRAAEAYRRDVLRRQEQERLAYDLHDTAVRGLVEIGFAAERMRETLSGDPAVEASLASIAAAAEHSMEALRGQLDMLVRPKPARTAGDVLDEIAEASLRADAGHRFLVDARDSVLPDAIADALVRIGQEALVNVDLHARSVAEVRLEGASGEWVLSVANGGAVTTAPNDADEPGHLGLRAMRNAAERVSGRVEREPARDGHGFLVRATIPGKVDR